MLLQARAASNRGGWQPLVDEPRQLQHHSLVNERVPRVALVSVTSARDAAVMQRRIAA